MKFQTKKLVLSALFMALTCVATMSIRIPTPGTGGYIHPGDALVILSGALFGPVWGFLIAGIGSCLADLLGGYLTYVPITFLIKGLVAFFSALAFQKLATTSKKHYLPLALGGIADIVLVSGGYFLFEFFLYGQGAAASIPANLIQGISGLLISQLLYPVLCAVPDVKRMLASNNGNTI